MPVTIIPDTGANNIYVNADTGRALIVITDTGNSLVVNTGPNVLVPNHNALDGKQGGQSNQFYHLTSGEYSNLVTGEVVRPEETGSFLTSTYINEVSGNLQNDIDSIFAVTGNFVLDSETGVFYTRNNPSGFITGVDLSNYYTESEINTKLSNTGNWNEAYSWGDHSLEGYITGVDLSIYVTGDVVRPEDTGNFYTTDNPSGYITGVDLSSYAEISFVTGISGVLDSRVGELENSTGDYYLNSNPSGYVTGNVIRPSDTGLFYPVSNPSGYISSSSVEAGYVALTGNQTISGVKTFATGINVTGDIVGGGTANRMPNQVAQTSDSVMTRKLIDEYPFLSPYQPIFQLATTAGWTTTIVGVGSAVNYAPDKLNLRVGQLVTAYTFAGAYQLQITPLGVATTTGYSRIDWTGRIFFDLTVIPAFGMTTSPFNQYRGLRCIHGIFNSWRSGGGTDVAGEGSVILAGGVGILVFTPSDVLQEVRLIVGAPTTNAAIISNATNATPIVITTTSSAAHELIAGDLVEVVGVAGNTAANGFWTVGTVTTTTFELSGSVGNGAYTSGGQWHETSAVLFSSGLVINRYTVSVQSGVATLYVNGTSVGNLSGCPTTNAGFGNFVNIIDNVGVSGVIGGGNYFIRNIKVGGIY